VGKASFKILPKNKLIIEKFTGTFVLSEYELMKKDEFDHPDYNQNFDVLADLRNGYWDFDSAAPDESVMSVTDYLKSNKDKIGKRKCAFLAINPDQVVSSIFYENFIKGLPIISKSFTTIEAALDWLAIIGKKEILEYLKY
jgi:hypothetical protein